MTDVLASPELRQRIADVVHAIAGGAGNCTLVADLGALVLSVLSHERYCVQVGSLYVQADLDAPEVWVGMVADDPDCGYRVGELHAWIGHELEPGSGRGEIIDFSARTYPDLITHLRSVTGEVMRWNRPAPPDYLWGGPPDLPRWVRFNVSPEATNYYIAHRPPDYGQSMAHHLQVALMAIDNNDVVLITPRTLAAERA